MLFRGNKSLALLYLWSNTSIEPFLCWRKVWRILLELLDIRR